MYTYGIYDHHKKVNVTCSKRFSSYSDALIEALKNHTGDVLTTELVQPLFNEDSDLNDYLITMTDGVVVFIDEE